MVCTPKKSPRPKFIDLSTIDILYFAGNADLARSRRYLPSMCAAQFQRNACYNSSNLISQPLVAENHNAVSTLYTREHIDGLSGRCFPNIDVLHINSKAAVDMVCGQLHNI
jgi:hypothetical protein